MKKPEAGAAAAVELSDRNLRQFTGYNIKRAYITVQIDMRATIATLGLRATTFSALATIVENPDITQTHLGQALSIERSGVVLIVDELENADLITRNKVENDRRSYALRATLKGRRLWDAAVKRMQEHEAHIFADLTAEERDQLTNLLARIEQARRDGPQG
jgi:DNA-binding MarR family transcriptional regulator